MSTDSVRLKSLYVGAFRTFSQRKGGLIALKPNF